MNTTYWNLFWTTGMPEAWLMSRGGMDAFRAQNRDGGIPQGERQMLSGPLVGFQPGSDSATGGPAGFY